MLVVETVVVSELMMTINRKVLIKGLFLGITLGTFICKSFYGTSSRTLQDLDRYKTTLTAILDAGKTSGITIINVINLLKDNDVSPEEMLVLAETITANKKTLDKTLTLLIKDLKDHAIEKTKEKGTHDQ